MWRIYGEKERAQAWRSHRGFISLVTTNCEKSAESHSSEEAPVMGGGAKGRTINKFEYVRIAEMDNICRSNRERVVKLKRGGKERTHEHKNLMEKILIVITSIEHICKSYEIKVQREWTE